MMLQSLQLMAQSGSSLTNDLLPPSMMSLLPSCLLHCSPEGCIQLGSEKKSAHICKTLSLQVTSSKH